MSWSSKVLSFLCRHGCCRAETSRLLNTSLSSVSVLRQLKDRLDLQIQRRSKGKRQPTKTQNLLKENKGQMTNACSLTKPSPAKALCKCLVFKLLEMCPVPWFDHFLLLGLFSLRLEATKNVKHPAYEIYKTYTKHTLMWTCIPSFC